MIPKDIPWQTSLPDKDETAILFRYTRATGNDGTTCDSDLPHRGEAGERSKSYISSAASLKLATLARRSIKSNDESRNTAPSGYGTDSFRAPVRRRCVRSTIAISSRQQRRSGLWGKILGLLYGSRLRSPPKVKTIDHSLGIIELKKPHLRLPAACLLPEEGF